MKSLGGYMFIFGVGSIGLYFLNMQFLALSWIDHWGPTVAWTIRGGLAVVGGALWLFGSTRQASTASE